MASSELPRNSPKLDPHAIACLFPVAILIDRGHDSATRENIMSSDLPTHRGLLAEAVRHELEHLRDEWWWFLILGVMLLLSGLLALVYPFVASVAAVIVLGASLLVSGVATIV